ncbi:MAG: hypothetical protein ACRC57_04710 [Sarcina sp.]
MNYNFETKVEQVSAQDAIVKTCKSIELSQRAMFNILRSQMKRLEYLVVLIEKDNIFIENPELLFREINSLVKALMAYECIIENKLDTVYRIYNEIL